MQEKSVLAAFLGDAQRRGVAVFNGRFVYTNPSFCNATGWTSEALVDMTPESLIQSPFLPGKESLHDITIRHGETDEPISAQLLLLDDPASAPLSGMILLPDVPVDALLLDARALHDIRNPLNTILGYGRIIQETRSLPSVCHKGADAIVEAAEQIQSGLGRAPRDKTAASLPSAEPGKTGENITVLIVDDDIDNRTVLGLFLKKTPLRLLYANDGASAYAIAAQEKPDLVFMDLHMPDMSGWEAARMIKKSDPAIKIVALTADVLAVEEERRDNFVFDRKLHKPFNRNEIRKTLAALTGLTIDPPQGQTPPQIGPAADALSQEQRDKVLALAKAGHISNLENIINCCREPQVKNFLLERLSQLDLEGIIAWVEKGRTA